MDKYLDLEDNEQIFRLGPQYHPLGCLVPALALTRISDTENFCLHNSILMGGVIIMFFPFFLKMEWKLSACYSGSKYTIFKNVSTHSICGKPRIPRNSKKSGNPEYPEYRCGKTRETQKTVYCMKSVEAVFCDLTYLPVEVILFMIMHGPIEYSEPC